MSFLVVVAGVAALLYAGNRSWTWNRSYFEQEKHYLEVLRAIKGKRHPLLVMFAPKWLIYEAMLRVHPRRLEINEYELIIYSLQRESGEAARAEVQALSQELADLIDTPLRVKAVDGDDYVRLIQPQLATLRAMRRRVDKAYLDDRRDKLANELS